MMFLLKFIYLCLIVLSDFSHQAKQLMLMIYILLRNVFVLLIHKVNLNQEGKLFILFVIFHLPCKWPNNAQASLDTHTRPWKSAPSQNFIFHILALRSFAILLFLIRNQHFNVLILSWANKILTRHNIVASICFSVLFLRLWKNVTESLVAAKLEKATEEKHKVNAHDFFFLNLLRMVSKIYLEHLYILNPRCWFLKDFYVLFYKLDIEEKATV